MSTASHNTAGRLGSQAALFFVGNIFTLLVGLPLQIYVARMLGTTGLGVFSLLEGGMSLAAGFIAFGLAPTLVRFVPAHLERGEYAAIRILVRKGALMLLVASALLYVLVWILAPALAKHFPELADQEPMIVLMGSMIPLTLLAFYLQQGLRGFQEVRHIVFSSSFLQLAVKALLTVLLLGAGLQGGGYAVAVIVSQLVAIVWMAAVLWLKLARLPPVNNSQPAIQQQPWWDYAGVMYKGSLLGMAGAYLDRFLVGAAAGPHPVGILMVLRQLQQMPVIFQQMFLSVASPMFSSAHARGDQREIQHIYHLTTDWVIRLSLPLFIFMAVFAEPLLRLYGEDFARDGVLPFRILLAAQLINLAFGPIGHLMYMSGLEKPALRIAFWQMLVTAGGFVTLVPPLGLIGAALTMFVSILFINVAELVVSRRSIGLRWGDRRYWRWLAPAVICCIVAVAAQSLIAEISAVVLVTMLAALYLVFHGTSLAQGLHADDRQLLAPLFARLGLEKTP